MRFEVGIGDRRKTVEVRRMGAGWTARVDGQMVAVSLAPSATGWSMLVREEPGPRAADGLARWELAARSYEIAVERQGHGARLVHVNGRAIPVGLLDPRRRASSGLDTSAATTGPLTVAAPMPGRVVKVLVKPGDVVAARQGLVVVEAMKMENELRAARAGTVTDVRAREGQSVDAGTVLVVLH